MQIDPKEQKRLLALLDSDFRDGLASLSPQALSILDRIVSNTVRDAGGAEHVTPALIKGVIEIYDEMWSEGFRILHP